MILRVCVVIPSFDDARTISEVVKDVVTATPFPVLILDEGSETPVSHVLYSWEVRGALETGRVKVLRSEIYRGRGTALQTAIRELVKRGFTHMLTMDASGRYSAQDILRLVEEAKNAPFALIVGGSCIRQNGFRLYPLFPLQTMRFLTRDGDFDFEALLRLVWRGIEKKEIAVGPSHKGLDQVWNSFLDAVLFTVLRVGRLRRPRMKKFGPGPWLERAMKSVLWRFGWNSGQVFARYLVGYFYLFSQQARLGIEEYWKLREPCATFWQTQSRVWRQISMRLSMWVDERYQNLHVSAKFASVHRGAEPLAQTEFASHLSAEVGAWTMTARLLELTKPCARPDAFSAGEYELIPFMGRLIPLDVTLFRRAGERNCPLVFSFGVRVETGGYEFHTLPVKDYYFTEGVTREIQIYHWAGEFLTGLESILKLYPEQWFNFYPVWSAVPQVVTGRTRLIEDLDAAPVGESRENVKSDSTRSPIERPLEI